MNFYQNFSKNNDALLYYVMIILIIFSFSTIRISYRNMILNMKVIEINL